MSLEADITPLTNARNALADKSTQNFAISVAATKLFKKHIRARGINEKNKLGVKSTFWDRVLKATKAGHDDKRAWVEMPRPVAQRYFGGTIKPTGTKSYLTIPISKNSYGKAAGFFKDAFILRFDAASLFIVQSVGSGKRHKLEFLYRLLRRVTQKGDKSILPTSDQIESAVKKELKSFIIKKK